MVSLPFLHEKNKSLAAFSMMGVGGPASYFTTVSTAEEMQIRVAFAMKEGIPFFVLGKGSNSLFDDRGYAGLVILNQIDYLEQEGSCFRVGSGYSFARLGQITAKRGFAGLEFAAGIPATVGGAVFMNAGANGQDVSQTLKSVRFVDEQQHVITKFDFTYRHSIFHEMRGAIVEATFELCPKESAKEKQRELVQYRLKTQPYGEKSCGCVFRNPEGEIAGRLIEQCGLKGKRVGGAIVSPMHANFIVNEGGSSEDVRQLIREVQEKIRQETGVILEEELRFVPYVPS